MSTVPTDRVRPYTQLLRGDRHRWWRPLLSLVIAVAGILLIGGASIVALFVVILVSGVRLDSAESFLTASFDEWWMLLLTNLGLAALILVSMLAVWGGHLWRPRWVSSVVGGLRWRWMLACAVVTVLVAVAATAVLWAFTGPPSGVGVNVVALLVVMALTTPLQAAGEEYLFRGWLSQAVGSLFARAVVGVVVAALLSATLFALAHGGQNLWLFVDRFAFGMLASYLVWRTGGLEAAIAAHAVNNVVVFVPTILTGGLEEAVTVTEAPPGLVLLDVVSMVVIGVLLTWLAHRRGVQREFVEPPPVPGPQAGHGLPVLDRPAGLG